MADLDSFREEGAFSARYEKGTSGVTEFCLIATAAGPVGLAWSADGLTRVQLSDVDGATTRARLVRSLPEPTEADPPDWLIGPIGLLQAYFTGRETDFSAVPLDFSGIQPFRRQLYESMRTLGWGETITYGGLAERVGQPGAAQTVGTAMGRNPWPIIVPCHRVLASGNKLGGFSAPGGKWTKLFLLDLEGVRLNPSSPAQMAFSF